MMLAIWKEKPDWWDSLISKLEEKAKERPIFLTKEKLKLYLVEIGAIDLRDRGYRTILAMCREALLRWEHSNLKVERISKRSLKVVYKNDD